MTFTFAANDQQFGGLSQARLCLLALCNRGVVVTRLRISGDDVVIEIDRAIETTEPAEQRGDYASAKIADCRVIWKII